MKVLTFNSQFPTSKRDQVQIDSWLDRFLFATIWPAAHGESVVESCNLIVLRCAKIMQHGHGHGVHSGKQDGAAVCKDNHRNRHGHRRLIVTCGVAVVR